MHMYVHVCEECRACHWQRLNGQAFGLGTQTERECGSSRWGWGSHLSHKQHWVGITTDTRFSIRSIFIMQFNVNYLNVKHDFVGRTFVFQRELGLCLWLIILKNRWKQDLWDVIRDWMFNQWWSKYFKI